MTFAVIVEEEKLNDHSFLQGLYVGDDVANGGCGIIVTILVPPHFSHGRKLLPCQ
jgi:hypothetical protein